MRHEWTRRAERESVQQGEGSTSECSKVSTLLTRYCQAQEDRWEQDRTEVCEQMSK